MTFSPAAQAARGYFVAGLLCVLLAGCGGGGSSETPPPPPPPTELPQTLEVTAPAEAAPLDAPVVFSSNAVDPATKLKYSWQFGDGSSSSVANPSHSYAKPGVYSVALVITNEAGSQRSANSVVSIADMQLVRGKVCSGANNAGWCWQKPLPQGNALLDYFFIDANQGWAVGEAGTVMATSDGGATWRAQRSGTDLTLAKVVFSTPQLGWIAGPNGFLLKTTDGGAHWTAQSWGQSSYALAIGATDADKAWVLGASSNALYLTNDGGSRWTQVAGPANTSVQRYVALSTSDIWAVTYAYGNPPLYHSTDGGAHWSSVALPTIESFVSRSINDLQFSDAMHGWLAAYEQGYDYATQTWVSRSVLLKTADGGASWQSFNQPTQGAGSYKFFDAQNGYAWTSWYGGSVLRTTDGGLSWQALTAPPMQSYNYVMEFKAFTLQTLLIKDSGGRVHLSVDAGATWTERSASGAPAAAINSVWFFDSREGMAIGSDGGTHRTSDGGQTWASTTPQQALGWRRLQFLPDASVGWIIADSGTIYRSTDKGQTWFSPVPQNSATLNSASDFHFVDGQNGWAVAGYSWYNQATIYRSVDGGGSWKPVEGSVGLGLTALRFADASHGVAVGSSGIAMVTSDAGVTWSPRPTGSDQPMRRVVFIDGQTALAVGGGGAIVRSTDRGQNWTRIESGTVNGLNDVRFATAKLGFAVGDFGTVLVTRDGGLSWDVQPSGNRSSMLGVFFVDEQTGWIVGDQGRILVTATGGH